jgi:hypothetical protein
LAAARYNPEVDTLATTKISTEVPVGKPGPFQFFRTDPRPGYADLYWTLEFEGDQYLVINPEARARVQRLLRLKKIFTIVDAFGNTTLWPIGMPTNGKTNRWHSSAMKAAEIATEQWVRIESNREIGAYETWGPVAGELTPVEPRLPTQSFDELMNIAFAEFIIDDPDHPVIRRLLFVGG